MSDQLSFAEIGARQVEYRPKRSLGVFLTELLS
jgi:hypothetical protein